MTWKEIGFFQIGMSVEDRNQIITIWETLKEPLAASFNGNNWNISISNRLLSFHHYNLLYTNRIKSCFLFWVRAWHELTAQGFNLTALGILRYISTFRCSALRTGGQNIRGDHIYYSLFLVYSIFSILLSIFCILFSTVYKMHLFPSQWESLSKIQV